MQIENCIGFGIRAEIVVITAKRLGAVRMIEHRGYPVKAEAVEAELFQPIAQVGQQELAHLRPPVVEALGIPRRVFAARAGMEVLVARAVEVIEPFTDVFNRMRVHHV